MSRTTWEIRVNIYIDGVFRFKSKLNLTPSKKGSTFNIGAGLDDAGWLGYNFIGDIANVMVYDEPLNINRISEYAEGRIPEGKVILDWKSE